MRCLLKGWPDARPVQKRSDDIELVPGHFWGFIENNEHAINTLKRAPKTNGIYLLSNNKYVSFSMFYT